MGLQVYYVAISIYGWYYWLKGGKHKCGFRKPGSGKKTSGKVLIISLIATVFIYVLISLFFLILPTPQFLTWIR
jgi:nicotinamide mononucleotide transporter